MKIKVLSSKQTIVKDGKNQTFYRYFSPCRIQVVDENGEDLGVQEKNIRVHFTKVATRKLPDEKVFAIIETANSKDIDLPYVWKVTTNEKGEKKYPEIWIRDFDLITPLEYKPRGNTCEPIIDEPSELVEEETADEVDLPF